MPYNRTIMLEEYHVKIVQQALGTIFSEKALAKIIEANLYQDRLAGQIGHDEYHFGNNAFEKSYAYLEEQRALVISSLMSNDPPSAWAAFGRLTHTAQDFYAHSNYIDMWLARQLEGRRPEPSTIDPIEPDLLHSPALVSGKIYPLEILSYIKFLKPLVIQLLPRDSHAWMNIDSPERGFQFDYVMQAAVKRTSIEFEATTKDLGRELVSLFADK